MARKPKGYWEKRSTELMKSLESGTESTIEDLAQVYNQATRNINKEIVKIFKNYSKDTGLTKEVLTELLNKKESDTYYKNLLKVIQNDITDDEVKKKLLAKYNAPAYAYRIKRYQALQDYIDVEMKKTAGLEEQITKERYIRTIEEGYYHNIFDMQNGLGYGFNFSQLDMKTINLMLNEKWINEGNFSTRIWDNNEKLSNYLQTQFTADMMTGKSIYKMSRELDENMNVGIFNAIRLVRTEVNHFSNEAEMLSYEECGIEKYKFIATLDERTCEECAKLDNKVFEVAKRKAGVNYPPLHPLDRCTTIAVIDDVVTEGLQRRARNENEKSILVPADMSYKEWAKEYAPEQYKKYYLNQALPKTKAVADSILEKQLSFYEKDKKGNIKLKFIPKSCIISNVHIIAGKGTKTVFRNANNYANNYGGAPEDWMKKVGKIESDKYIFDIHWVEHDKYGKHDSKIGRKTLK